MPDRIDFRPSTPPAEYLEAELPISAVETTELREMWWRLVRLGSRLPSEPGIIVICGGQS